MLRKSSFIRKPFAKTKCRTEIAVKLLDISSLGTNATNISLAAGTHPNKTAAVRGNVEMAGDVLGPAEDLILKFKTFVYQSNLAYESKEQRINVLLDDSGDAYFCIPIVTILDALSPIELSVDLITSEGEHHYLHYLHHLHRSQQQNM